MESFTSLSYRTRSFTHIIIVKFVSSRLTKTRNLLKTKRKIDKQPNRKSS